MMSFRHKVLYMPKRGTKTVDTHLVSNESGLSRGMTVTLCPSADSGWLFPLAGARAKNTHRFSCILYKKMLQVVADVAIGNLLTRLCNKVVEISGCYGQTDAR